MRKITNQEYLNKLQELNIDAIPLEKYNGNRTRNNSEL